MLSILGSASMLSGCGSANKSAEDKKNRSPSVDKPLRILVIDGPELAKRIERYWAARSDAPFEITEATSTVAREQIRLAADVVVFPASLVGSLAEAGKIAPLDHEFLLSDAFRASDLLEHARTTEVAWGSETFTVCLGSPSLVLYYRADLLAAKGLAPPTTWAEYAEVVKVLAEAPAGVAQNWTSCIEPLTGRWGALTLLARAACYARHRSEYAALFDLATMQPLIDQPPFVRALEELLAVVKSQPHPILDASPASAKTAIYTGQCALAWSWPSSAAVESVEAIDPLAAQHLSIAQLPGSRDVYNFGAKRWEVREPGEAIQVPMLGVTGLSAAITATARQRRAAETFLAWISTSDDGVEVLANSSATTCFRKSQLAQIQPWCEANLSSAGAKAYAEVLTQTNHQGVTLLTPRLPGGEDYLLALGEAVRRVIAGEHAVTESLQQAAKRFGEITEVHGLSKQRTAYRRSLGL